MDQSKVTFGDKLFLHGDFLQYLGDFEDFVYCEMVPFIDYASSKIETYTFVNPVPGFIVEFLLDGSLATATPFYQAELVDITDRLSMDLPLPSGNKVWMPTKSLLSMDSVRL